ncbi:hypothetical protein ACOSQ2_020593 [Xanthoceras sorbifolium]
MFSVEGGTHVLTTVAGTPGYLDPELANGDIINNVVDLKAVEVAVPCISQSLARRSSMKQVVMDLNESLAIEVAHKKIDHEIDQLTDFAESNLPS